MLLTLLKRLTGAIHCRLQTIRSRIVLSTKPTASGQVLGTLADLVGCVKSQRTKGSMKSNSPQADCFWAVERHWIPDKWPDLGLDSPLWLSRFRLCAET
jgi:hypothetical protein